MTLFDKWLDENRYDSKNLLPSILLVLADDKAHGFKLGGETQVMGYLVDLPDFGTIYRLLKQLEDEKMATSEWDTSQTGPARKVYSLTPKGFDYLDSIMIRIREQCGRFEDMLEKYEKVKRKDRRK